jgi:hypothetical protein
MYCINVIKWREELLHNKGRNLNEEIALGGSLQVTRSHKRRNLRCTISCELENQQKETNGVASTDMLLNDRGKKIKS